MQHILSSTLPIFLITILGIMIKREWLTSEEFWRGLEKLSYFLLFPSVLFSLISTADLSASSVMKLVIGLTISTSIVALILVIYQQRTNGDKPQFTSTFQGATRYNSYIFFGLSQALFGSEGLAIVAITSSYMIVVTNIMAVMVFVHYTPGSSIAKNRQESFLLLLKLVGKNPLIIASVVGFIFNYSGVTLHLGLKKAVMNLADAALAIGMLNVGAGLKFVLCPAQLKQVVLTSIVKLIVLPVITITVLSLMSITGMAKSIGILYSCLPCASTAYVLSRQLGGHPDSMAAIITFSTLFSVVSLSALMYILN